MERKQKAVSELQNFQAERQKQIQQRRLINAEQEKNFYEVREEHRKGSNPWERVIDNCEMNSSQYVGTKDVTRMRQAMLARKADITKAGGMDKVML